MRWRITLTLLLAITLLPASSSAHSHRATWTVTYRDDSIAKVRVPSDWTRYTGTTNSHLGGTFTVSLYDGTVEKIRFIDPLSVRRGRE